MWTSSTDLVIWFLLFANSWAKNYANNLNYPNYGHYPFGENPLGQPPFNPHHFQPIPFYFPYPEQAAVSQAVSQNVNSIAGAVQNVDQKVGSGTGFVSQNVVQNACGGSTGCGNAPAVQNVHQEVGNVVEKVLKKVEIVEDCGGKKDAVPVEIKREKFECGHDHKHDSSCKETHKEIKVLTHPSNGPKSESKLDIVVEKVDKLVVPVKDKIQTEIDVNCENKKCKDGNVLSHSKNYESEKHIKAQKEVIVKDNHHVVEVIPKVVDAEFFKNIFAYPSHGKEFDLSHPHYAPSTVGREDFNYDHYHKDFLFDLEKILAYDQPEPGCNHKNCEPAKTVELEILKQQKPIDFGLDGKHFEEKPCNGQKSCHSAVHYGIADKGFYGPDDKVREIGPIPKDDVVNLDVLIPQASVIHHNHSPQGHGAKHKHKTNEEVHDSVKVYDSVHVVDEKLKDYFDFIRPKKPTNHHSKDFVSKALDNIFDDVPHDSVKSGNAHPEEVIDLEVLTQQQPSHGKRVGPHLKSNKEEHDYEFLKHQKPYEEVYNSGKVYDSLPVVDEKLKDYFDFIRPKKPTNHHSKDFVSKALGTIFVDESAKGGKSHPEEVIGLELLAQEQHSQGKGTGLSHLKSKQDERDYEFLKHQKPYEEVYNSGKIYDSLPVVDEKLKDYFDFIRPKKPTNHHSKDFVSKALGTIFEDESVKGGKSHPEEVIGLEILTQEQSSQGKKIGTSHSKSNQEEKDYEFLKHQKPYEEIYDSGKVYDSIPVVDEKLKNYFDFIRPKKPTNHHSKNFVSEALGTIFENESAKIGKSHPEEVVGLELLTPQEALKPQIIESEKIQEVKIVEDKPKLDIGIHQIEEKPKCNCPVAIVDKPLVFNPENIQAKPFDLGFEHGHKPNCFDSGLPEHQKQLVVESEKIYDKKIIEEKPKLDIGIHHVQKPLIVESEKIHGVKFFEDKSKPDCDVHHEPHIVEPEKIYEVKILDKPKPLVFSPENIIDKPFDLGFEHGHKPNCFDSGLPEHQKQLIVESEKIYDKKIIEEKPKPGIGIHHVQKPPIVESEKIHGVKFFEDKPKPDCEVHHEPHIVESEKIFEVKILNQPKPPVFKPENAQVKPFELGFEHGHKPNCFDSGLPEHQKQIVVESEKIYDKKIIEEKPKPDIGIHHIQKPPTVESEKIHGVKFFEDKPKPDCEVHHEPHIVESEKIFEVKILDKPKPPVFKPETIQAKPFELGFEHGHKPNCFDSGLPEHDKQLIFESENIHKKIIEEKPKLEIGVFHVQKPLVIESEKVHDCGIHHQPHIVESDKIYEVQILDKPTCFDSELAHQQSFVPEIHNAPKPNVVPLEKIHDVRIVSEKPNEFVISCFTQNEPKAKEIVNVITQHKPNIHENNKRYESVKIVEEKPMEESIKIGFVNHYRKTYGSHQHKENSYDPFKLVGTKPEIEIVTHGLNGNIAGKIEFDGFRVDETKPNIEIVIPKDFPVPSYGSRFHDDVYEAAAEEDDKLTVTNLKNLESLNARIKQDMAVPFDYRNNRKLFDFINRQNDGLKVRVVESDHGPDNKIHKGGIRLSQLLHEFGQAKPSKDEIVSEVLLSQPQFFPLDSAHISKLEVPNRPQFFNNHNDQKTETIQIKESFVKDENVFRTSHHDVPHNAAHISKVEVLTQPQKFEPIPIKQSFINDENIFKANHHVLPPNLSKLEVLTQPQNHKFVPVPIKESFIKEEILLKPNHHPAPPNSVQISKSEVLTQSQFQPPVQPEIEKEEIITQPIPPTPSPEELDEIRAQIAHSWNKLKIIHKHIQNQRNSEYVYNADAFRKVPGHKPNSEIVYNEDGSFYEIFAGPAELVDLKDLVDHSQVFIPLSQTGPDEAKTPAELEGLKPDAGKGKGNELEVIHEVDQVHSDQRVITDTDIASTRPGHQANSEIIYNEDGTFYEIFTGPASAVDLKKFVDHESFVPVPKTQQPARTPAEIEGIKPDTTDKGNELFVIHGTNQGNWRNRGFRVRQRVGDAEEEELSDKHDSGNEHKEGGDILKEIVDDLIELGHSYVPLTESEASNHHKVEEIIEEVHSDHPNGHQSIHKQSEIPGLHTAQQIVEEIKHWEHHNSHHLPSNFDVFRLAESNSPRFQETEEVKVLDLPIHPKVDLVKQEVHQGYFPENHFKIHEPFANPPPKIVRTVKIISPKPKEPCHESDELKGYNQIYGSRYYGNHGSPNCLVNADGVQFYGHPKPKPQCHQSQNIIPLIANRFTESESKASKTKRNKTHDPREHLNVVDQPNGVFKNRMGQKFELEKTSSGFGYLSEFK